ncbi:MAG TPA: Dabb family protein, partial [Planctomycetota bacterium]|nr:Dabb family protein [Planctomycetota bacterium]
MAARRRPTWAAALAGLALAALAGCGAPGRAPAPLQHVVLVKLRDKSQTDQLLADTRRYLSTVPQVSELRLGTPFDIGRTAADLDWHVGVIVGFANRQAYEGYLLHPAHAELVELWQPRWEWIRVYHLGESGGLRLVVGPAGRLRAPKRRHRQRRVGR